MSIDKDQITSRIFLYTHYHSFVFIFIMVFLLENSLQPVLQISLSSSVPSVVS